MPQHCSTADAFSLSACIFPNFSEQIITSVFASCRQWSFELHTLFLIAPNLWGGHINYWGFDSKQEIPILT